MLIDVQKLSPDRYYRLMVQTLIPRPIAWVLTVNSDGGFNLAPFSYFTGVSSDPPLLMISVARKPDGTRKDTWRNIVERGGFVVHIPRLQDARMVALSSGSYPADDSEVELCGIDTEAVDGQFLPRLVGPMVAFFCVRYEIHEIGDPTRAVIYGRVTHVHVDDAAARVTEGGRLLVDASRIDPLARLGGNQFAGLGERLEVPRPP